MIVFVVTVSHGTTHRIVYVGTDSVELIRTVAFTQKGPGYTTVFESWENGERINRMTF